MHCGDYCHKQKHWQDLLPKNYNTNLTRELFYLQKFPHLSYEPIDCQLFIHCWIIALIITYSK